MPLQRLNEKANLFYLYFLRWSLELIRYMETLKLSHFKKIEIGHKKLVRTNYSSLKLASFCILCMYLPNKVENFSDVLQRWSPHTIPKLLWSDNDFWRTLCGRIQWRRASNGNMPHGDRSIPFFRRLCWFLWRSLIDCSKKKSSNFL